MVPFGMRSGDAEELGKKTPSGTEPIREAGLHR